MCIAGGVSRPAVGGAVLVVHSLLTVQHSPVPEEPTGQLRSSNIHQFPVGVMSVSVGIDMKQMMRTTSPAHNY